ncbi:GTPase [Metabacillus crassostreae]|uniref:hypothetical protein n=1 Tax=Metabacillus crassostreae TaxID=929098 RepID=UPI00195BF896|nr:hypothetical protein [Metabacillus crassostreae]MBM7602122.1 GTPase [Metabacillus crassostreae]
MIRDKYQQFEDNTNDDVLKENQLISFIDGEGFDQFLQILIKGLYMSILFFCIPYFCFLFLTFIL